MPVVRMTAKKMSDAKVSFISLVERGANRIPFKVVKQEKDMSKAFSGLDLGSIFARKSEKPKAEVVGIVTLKGEGYESIKKQVEEAGFSVADIVENEDGSVIFKQGEFDGETTVVRLNDHLALVTKGFSPYNMEMGDGDVSFAEAAAARGFYPGVSAIMSTMSEMVESSVRKAASPSEAQKAVSKMFSEAQAYTTSFLSSLPTKAFKLEGVMPVAKEEGEDAPVGSTEQAVADAIAAAETATDTSVVKEAATETKAQSENTETSAQSEVVKAEVPAENALTAEGVAAIVQTTVNEKTAELAQKMDAMLAGIGAMSKSMDDMQGGVATLSTRVESAELVAKAAQAAVTGTVVVRDEGDGSTVVKREREYQGREIDTAYNPRVRKSSRH